MTFVSIKVCHFILSFLWKWVSFKLLVWRVPMPYSIISTRTIHIKNSDITSLSLLPTSFFFSDLHFWGLLKVLLLIGGLMLWCQVLSFLLTSFAFDWSFADLGIWVPIGTSFMLQRGEAVLIWFGFFFLVEKEQEQEDLEKWSEDHVWSSQPSK